jgi:S-adenosylmethionine/arginine decarboxylase-like enzyme
MTLGRHWIATLRGCAARPSLEQVARSLREVPDALGLSRMGEPLVRVADDGTIAGIVLLSASHASVHVPPGGVDCLCDLFSCAPFDADACSAAFAAVFAPARVDSTVVAR